jgi:hypothetical protein
MVPLRKIITTVILMANLSVYVLISASCGRGGSELVPTTATPTTLGLSTVSLDFGSQPVAMASSPAAITLTNTGNTTLNITKLALTGTDAGNFSQTNTCSASVAPGNKCTIAVLFTPSENGNLRASLAISANVVNSPQSVALTGKGLHVVILTWSPSTTPGIAGYNVFRSTTSRQSAAPLNSSPINDTIYADTDVQSNQKYSYWVTTVGPQGITESPDSPGASATVPTP